jgi:hypothetical protein
VTARDILDGIKALLGAATPGPWVARQDFIDGGVPDNSITLNGGGRGDYIGTIALHYDVRAANAEFIAAAPTDIARLVAAVEALLYIADNKTADNQIGRWWKNTIRAAIENALKESQ